MEMTYEEIQRELGLGVEINQSLELHNAEKNKLLLSNLFLNQLVQIYQNNKIIYLASNTIKSFAYRTLETVNVVAHKTPSRTIWGFAME